MPPRSRLEELRRRVQADPASVAFAALAEEYRRAGLLDQAIETCRAGLARHPGYVSARVTLGRALLAAGQADAARVELDSALAIAPENIAALRSVADALQVQGEHAAALERLRQASVLAPHDAELAGGIAALERHLGTRPTTRGMPRVAPPTQNGGRDASTPVAAAAEASEPAAEIEDALAPAAPTAGPVDAGRTRLQSAEWAAAPAAREVERDVTAAVGTQAADLEPAAAAREPQPSTLARQIAALEALAAGIESVRHARTPRAAAM